MLLGNSQTVIQMTKKGGIYTVPCKVNGLNMEFIFDTGASDVSISLTEALFMIRHGYLKEENILGNVQYSIANGDIAEGTSIIIDEIEIAGIKLTKVKASIIHETNSPLLLGQSAIQQLGKYSIDGNILTLMNKTTPNGITFSNDNNVGATVRIGRLEVMTKDLGEMEWKEAKKACAALGGGWRLPTKDELNDLYENKDKIGGFATNNYWSSTEEDYFIAWKQNFGIGFQKFEHKIRTYYVRAVRAF